MLWLTGPRGKWSPERADGAEAAAAERWIYLPVWIQDEFAALNGLFLYLRFAQELKRISSLRVLAFVLCG